jgi:hypothetical protein
MVFSYTHLLFFLHSVHPYSYLLEHTHQTLSVSELPTPSTGNRVVLPGGEHQE